MNGLYDILLFLFVLGAVSQGFNELGVFSSNIPDEGATIDNATVREIHQGALNQSTNEFNWIEVIKSFMRVMGMAIVTMFTIIPLVMEIMMAVGVDWNTAAIMAGMLQVPVTFVTLFGLYEFWTGRPSV